MKNLALIIILCFTGILISWGQSPQAFKYQAVARDLSGNVLPGQTVAFRMSILQGSSSGAVVYSERQALTTNEFGLASMSIGSGTVLSGSFTAINWGSNTYFLKTEIDPAGGTTYQDMGTSQFLSVPYALYSENSGQTFIAGTGIGITGNTISNTAPDQTVTLSGTGATTVTGTYPDFIINTPAAVPYTGGTGINVVGSIITNTAPNATHTGDATGSGALTVVKIQGKEIATTAPSNGQALKWNGSTLKWEPAMDNNTTYTAGTGINVTGTTISNTAPDQTVVLTGGTGIATSGVYPGFTVSNTLPNATHTGDATGSGALTVVKIQGKEIATTDPTNGQALKWNGTTLKWEPAMDNNTTYTAGTGINVTGTTISNTAPDQTVVLTGGTGIATSGVYPGFTVSNTLPNATHTGDATGSGALTVVKIQGQAVSSTLPALNQVLQWNGAQWTPSTLSNPSPGWLLTGNNGTNPANNFLGTTDNLPLNFRVNNISAGKIDPLLYNTSLGYKSSSSNTTGHSNTAIGNAALFQNTTRSNLVAIGDSALYNNGIGANENWHGTENTAVGSKALFANTTGQQNTAVGNHALFLNTTGVQNTAIGGIALYNNTTGYYNAAVGTGALRDNTTGHHNTACGYVSLYSNKANSRSTAIGHGAMFLADDRTADARETYNTAIGYEALMGSWPPSDNTGQWNTAVGDQAMYSNSVGGENTATGVSALYSNLTGSFNTATGTAAMRDNTNGEFNTATGAYALMQNTQGLSNTAIGYGALYYNKANSRNTAIGHGAMFYSDDRTSGRSTYNTAIGYFALCGERYNQSVNTGVSNTAVGDMALTNNTYGSWNTAVGVNALSNNWGGNHMTAFGYGADAATAYQDDGNALGYGAITNANGKTRIGDIWQNTIEGQVGWSTPSDGRFKTNVKEDVIGLEFIKRLRPVTYNVECRKYQEFLVKNMPDSLQQRYLNDVKRPEINPVKQTGFIAQEVEIAAKAVGYDFDGLHAPVDENDNYSLVYGEFVVPLVKAVQEQQVMIEMLQKEIESLKNLLENKK